MTRYRARGIRAGAGSAATASTKSPVEWGYENGVEFGATASDDPIFAEARRKAAEVIATARLTTLSVLLEPWDLAAFVTDVQQRLVDLGTTGGEGSPAIADHLPVLNRRLARVARGIERVTQLDADAHWPDDTLTSVLKIYAAAIACSLLPVGCDQLTALGEARFAAWSRGDLAPVPSGTRQC